MGWLLVSISVSSTDVSSRHQCGFSAQFGSVIFVIIKLPSRLLWLQFCCTKQYTIVPDLAGCRQHELCQHWLCSAVDLKWCFNRCRIITNQSQSAINTNPRIHRWQITLILIAIGAKLHQPFLKSALVAYSYCNKLDSHSHKWSILSTSIFIGCIN